MVEKNLIEEIFSDSSFKDQKDCRFFVRNSKKIINNEISIIFNYFEKFQKLHLLKNLKVKNTILFERIPKQVG